MVFIDDALLSKLVDKYGLEPENGTAAKSKLWAKVAREYNSISGNVHTKARLSKKWQNVKHIRKMKKQKLWQETGGTGHDHDSFEIGEESTSGGTDRNSKINFLDVGENMWNLMDHALRDLFLFLIHKYNIDDVPNPRVKNELWKNVAKDFHDVVENIVYVKHEKFTKKWQNWKQYNKVKGKPHPLENPDLILDFDVIREKVRKLKERSNLDPAVAALLARESDDNKGAAELIYAKQTSGGTLQDTDRSMAESTSMSSKQLEREVYVEALRCEQERHRCIVENGRLESEKLKRESDWMDVQLQMAHADLAMKRQECQDKGILLQ